MSTDPGAQLAELRRLRLRTTHPAPDTWQPLFPPVPVRGPVKPT